MGLASALSTALTGLNAAETSINVIGNNLANSSTIGYKASSPVFATQFAQTTSLGSAPSGDSGGTNPSQIGLGVQVAEITPNFSQGTLQTSSSPSDMAVQGDGFFMVQGNAGQTLYTRDGEFQTNSENQLVTASGDSLLGYGVDDDFNLNTTQLVPLTIPLGTSTVAQATQNVALEGDLPPTGAVANQAQIVQSAVLGDSSYATPPAGATAAIAVGPQTAPTTAVDTSNVGSLQAGTYSYQAVYVTADGTQSDPISFSVTVPSGDSNVSVDLSNIPTDSTGKYVGVDIYRTTNQSASGATPAYYLDASLTNAQAAAGYTDTTSDATLQTAAQFSNSTISGNYSYYVTFVKAGLPESAPSPLIGPLNVSNDQVVLSDLPTPTGQYAGGEVRIYRNTAADPSSFYAVATVPSGTSYVDDTSDTTITNSSSSGYEQLDFNGPPVTTNTLLTQVQEYNGTGYVQPFSVGTLTYTGNVGGTTLSAAKLQITSTTTVQDLVNFLSQASGIQPASADPMNPIPGDISGAAQGGLVLGDGQIQIVSNNGTANAVSIPLTAFQMTPASGAATTDPDLNFETTQSAVGQSVSTNFIAYDSLGIPVNVNITMALQNVDGNSTTYRWFASSPDNEPTSGNSTAVGTGLVTFDGNGNVESVTNDTVSIQRTNVASQSLQFNLNFGQVSGLSTTAPTLSVTNQDGSAPGTLTSYNIGSDGGIQGVYSNGVTRTLGQIQLANFTNPDGLIQEGANTFSSGVNSGLPVQGTPGTQGIGTVVSGSLEESNTDIGTSLVSLILASTSYQGNAQVVTTTNQLFNDLMQLTR
ncbi:MAG TPA: flagellar hook-basal body complex protein [Pirellulales bacterium]|jgi:flagellar hook protein FlgE|nr:flagellar hook-basal body complex protein [Pirellulales bacterium]